MYRQLSFTDAEKRKIGEHASRHGMNAAADKFGIGRATAWRWMKAAGFSLGKRKTARRERLKRLPEVAKLIEAAKDVAQLVRRMNDGLKFSAHEAYAALDAIEAALAEFEGSAGRPGAGEQGA